MNHVAGILALATLAPLALYGQDTSSLTIRVLQSEQIPYTQQYGGGVSTNCQITGTSDTTTTANTFGGTTFGNGTTNSNLRMNCASYNNTYGWPHMLSVMFVEASDGNAYIIACDKAWRWSKCGPLNAGLTFNARFTAKGIEVQAVNAKGKNVRPIYSVLQSRAMR